MKSSINQLDTENKELRKSLKEMETDMVKQNVLLGEVKEERESLIDKLIATEQRAQKALSTSEKYEFDVEQRKRVEEQNKNLYQENLDRDRTINDLKSSMTKLNKENDDLRNDLKDMEPMLKQIEKGDME